MTDHVITLHDAGVSPPKLKSVHQQQECKPPVDITCHDRTVPPALDAELRTLYGNIHSTIDHLAAYGGLTEITHVYVARQADSPVAIFLFRLEHDTARVVNEGMSLDAAELDRFSDYVFSTWPQVATISFHAVRIPAPLSLRHPAQHHACTAEIAMPLPDCAGAYTSRLGKNMRRNLRRYQERLQARHPTWRYDVHDREDAPESLIREVIRLNRMRIEGKHLAYGLDDEVERLVSLVRRCGTLGVMTVEGKVIAGGIGYHVGDTWYFKVNAHDPAYNAYSAGILSCYHMICECIARGCREFNFMWNEYEYKYALGGRQRILHRVVIYRSRLHVLLNAARVAAETSRAMRHEVSALLEKAKDGKDLNGMERAIAGLLFILRTGKRMLAG